MSAKIIIGLLLILLALPVTIAADSFIEKPLTNKLLFKPSPEIIESIKPVNPEPEWVVGESIPESERPKLLTTRPSSSMITREASISRFTPNKGLPASVFDWRNVNGSDWVTPIRNQGSCGSCWVFAAVGVVESRVNIALNDPSYDLDLAEQEIVSCYGDGLGCNRGLESNALSYMQVNGIVNESCFPYTATNGVCGDKCSDNPMVTVLGYALIDANVVSIKQAINDYGPVTVYFAVYEDFYDYDSGVYSYAYGGYEGLHAISIIGYNDTAGYWICKNSWGSGWGENGYFRIDYNENVMDYWSWDPTQPGELFLDDSYLVFSTDLDGDLVGDESDNCPFSVNPTQDDDIDGFGNVCDSCPITPGVAYYNGCPDIFGPEINLTNPPWIGTGLINLSWYTLDYCDVSGNLSINYSIPDSPDNVIGGGLPANGSLLWDSSSINSKHTNLTLFALDDFGNSGSHVYVDLRIDNEPPELINLQPVNNFLTGGSVSFNFTANDSVSLWTECNLTINDFVYELNQHMVPYFYETSVFEPGVNNWSVSCIDQIGLSNTSPVRTVIIDTQGPNISFNNPENKPYNGYPGIINLSVIDGLSSISDVSLELFYPLDGLPSEVIELINSSPYWYNDTYQFLNDTYIGLNASANDSFANANSNVSYLFIDTKVPSLSLESPVDGFNSTNDSYFFSFNVSDQGMPIINCSLLINDEYFNSSMFNTSLLGNFTYDWGFDGVFNWSVNCSDFFYHNLSETRVITRDATPPNLIIHSPLNQTYLFNASFNVSVNDALVGLDELAYRVDAGGWTSFSSEPEPFNLSDLGGGSHSILIKANDTLNNSVDALVYFTIDNASPIIDLRLPLNESYPFDHVELNFSYFDHSSVSCEYTLDSNGPVNFDCDEFIMLGPFSEPTHTLNLSVIDVWGQSTNASPVTFMVNLPPYFTSAIDNSYTITENETFSLDFDALDPENQVLTFSDDSSLFNIDSSSGLIDWTSSYTSSGTYSITVSVSDGFMSVSEYFDLIILDNVFCGNGVCDSGESCSDCSVDCGVCPEDDEDDEDEESVDEDLGGFPGGGGLLPSEPDEDEISNQTTQLESNVTDITADLDLLTNLSLFNLSSEVGELFVNLTGLLDQVKGNLSLSNKSLLLAQSSDLLFNLSSLLPEVELVLDEELLVNQSIIDDSILNQTSNKTGQIGLVSVNVSISQSKKVIRVRDKVSGKEFNVTVISREVINSEAESLTNVTVVEVIPKSFAGDVSELVFHNSEYLIVIEEDPIVSWVFPELGVGESVSVGYEVSKDLSGVTDAPESVVLSTKQLINDEVVVETVEAVTGLAFFNNNNSVLSLIGGLTLLGLTVYLSKNQIKQM